MHRFIAALLGVILGIALAGCAADNTSEVDALRSRFTTAGGSCDTWTAVTEPRSVGAISCADGAKVYLFTGDAQRADFVKTELETNTDIRARTHIMLSGENWLIIDRIAVIVAVMPSLHGIIQGRNGANP